jgi:hypothetical protein
MKLEYLIFFCLVLVALWALSLNSTTLKEGNTLMSSLIDPFFDFLKSVLSAILNFFSGLLEGLH